ncbi:nuclear hormone receptor FTZ-F1 isoform X2 [Neocloeon triangulifer]|uniref:nuclear hormone receptor FTZ-F1 isoform X2 n=1 Tax=Neocloeon triangulifer TaxID=2078957 RepID=UPI00286F78E7|nr:nuclear hormone receptor FTZ-F1 isoform X2 [Neocloeon triangulifer]
MLLDMDHHSLASMNMPPFYLSQSLSGGNSSPPNQQNLFSQGSSTYMTNNQMNNNSTGGGAAGGANTPSPTNGSLLIHSFNNLDPTCLFGSSGGPGATGMTDFGAAMGAAGATSLAAAAGTPDLPDTKDIIEELCPVCGDKVSGYHYGLLTCESCKGFFKRTVQNKKVYTCVADRSCHIDKTQRKRCPFCRFQKCLEVGMKLEAVRADRMRGGRNKFGPMYKRDRARKLQLLRQRQMTVGGVVRGGTLMAGGNDSGLSYSPNGGYSPAAASSAMHIKQEIQIPQVSSLTSSPDSSPSPIAAQLMGNSVPQMIGSSNNLLNSGSGAFASAASTAPSGSAVAQALGPKMSPLIREFVQGVDDREWQSSLFGLLQNQTYNQCEVDLFELMCKVLDQNLFSQVDWARNSIFFKDLKVDDQMKLLQHSWSDMLVLDHMHQRMHNNLPDETTLPNGQKFDLLCLGLLGVPSLADAFGELAAKLAELKFDVSDYVCLKFLMLLNPAEVRGLVNRTTVQEGYEQVQQALLDYTVTCYPQIQDKFVKLLNLLPEVHAIASRGEDHLYQKHCTGGAPTQTLLMEMLHAKRK